MDNLTIPLRFEQIQHCAIVQYCSPLTGGKIVTGIFYKPEWDFSYYDGERWHHLQVTPSQVCDVIVDALSLCTEYCKFKYTN